MTRREYLTRTWRCFWTWPLGHDWEQTSNDTYTSYDRCRKCPKALWYGSDGAFNIGRDLHEVVRGAALEARVTELEAALERIQANAASWHGDDAAKSRALTVIADEARAALAASSPNEQAS